MFSFLKTNLQTHKLQQYLIEHSVTEVIECLSLTAERSEFHYD